MKKWFAEEFAFTITVTGFLQSEQTENYCRNGEEIGDRYCCTYGCPVNTDGYGICSKVMLLLYPLMDAVRCGYCGPRAACCTTSVWEPPRPPRSS